MCEGKTAKIIVDLQESFKNSEELHTEKQVWEIGDISATVRATEKILTFLEMGKQACFNDAITLFLDQTVWQLFAAKARKGFLHLAQLQREKL